MPYALSRGTPAPRTRRSRHVSSGGRLGLLLLWVGALAACGGAGSRRAADAPAADPREGTPGLDGAEGGASGAAVVAPPGEAAPVDGLPTQCSGEGELCLPPHAFVKRLCQDAYMGAAIALFEKSSPFSRGYVRSRAIKAVNTLGGPASEVNLGLGEEVIILTHTGGPGPQQMQVSGMGGYDVLRWDGTCATLADGELSTRAPGKPRHAPFSWQYIDTNIQDALLENAAIEAARRKQRKFCQGVTLGPRSAACVAADDDLGQRIVLVVRGGISLPRPERMP